MKKTSLISCLFLDIGGVLLSNGWDHHARRRAARFFKLDWNEMESRHKLFMSPCELGYIGLEEYLGRVVFFKSRSFRASQFRKFMFAQSKAHSNMIDLMVQLKSIYKLKVIAVSNEGGDLNAFRIQKFKLAKLIDFFVCSSFVHLQKPDRNIYRMALNMAQVRPEKVIYLENTASFDLVAESFGIRSIIHRNYRSTRAQLASLGLPLLDGVVYE